MARVDNTGGSGFTVDNGTGLVVRTKLNQVIAALSTLNQGSGEMSVGVAAYVPHIDGNTLKIRNAANNAFVSLGDVSLANLGHASLSVANTFTARATFSVTSSITLPSGTTAQRDGSPAVGMIRHNSETNTFEGYNNGAWGSLSGASGISNVVDDTSPQLGGNLDLQAFELNTSTSNGNIKVTPNGTGLFEVKGNTNAGTLQLNCESNSHGVKLKSPAHSAGQSFTLILPDNQIAADKILKVKSISGSGSTAIGQLEFADAGAGKTLQTIMVEKTDVTSFSGGTTRADISGITVNITPSATNSKILIHSTLNFCGRAGQYAFGLYLMRDSTDLAKGDASSSRTRATIGGLTDSCNNYDMRPWHYTYLDSPNTTSQVTYKWQWNDPFHNLTLYLNRTYDDTDNAYTPRGASNIIVQEIAG